MTSFLGTLFALGALFGWSAGDFFIQRTTRAIGITKSLLFIGLTGAVLLFPFVSNEIPAVFSDSRGWPLLAAVCLVVLLSAYSNFQGLKIGKLSVVLPLTGLELPVTILLTTLLGHEVLTPVTYLPMAMAVVGISLTTITSLKNLRSLNLESGALYALVGAIGLGITNYLIGQTSRVYSPLFTLWLTHTVSALAALVVLAHSGRLRLKPILHDLKTHPGIITLQSLLDNAAWLSYAYSTTLIPIGIAATISESFIVLGLVYGVAFNRERLKPHQVVGIIIALAGVLFLSYLAA